MRTKKFVYGQHKRKAVDKFGNVLKYECSECVGLSTDKAVQEFKKTGIKPQIKLERHTNFFIDEMDRNLTQVYIVNPENNNVLLEYDEYYTSNNFGMSEYIDSSIIPYDDFFVLTMYLSSQVAGKQPQVTSIAKVFDYFGKELDIGKLKFRRTKNIEEKIKEKLAENQPM